MKIYKLPVLIKLNAFHHYRLLDLEVFQLEPKYFRLVIYLDAIHRPQFLVNNHQMLANKKRLILINNMDSFL